MEMQLSNQALGAIMLALQESLLEQTDIVPVLKNFKLKNGTDGLVVVNPPTVRFSNNEEIAEEELTNMAE
jgi:hypothetical protein